MYEFVNQLDPYDIIILFKKRLVLGGLFEIKCAHIFMVWNNV